MGVLGMVMPIYQLLLTIVTLGLPTVLARFVAIDLSTGNTVGIGKNKRTCFLLIFILSVGIALGILFFSTSISSLLYKDQRTGTVLRFLAPLLILTSFSLTYRGYYRGLGHTLPLAGSELGGALAEFIYVVRRLSTLPPFTTETGINLIMTGSIFGESITLSVFILWDIAKNKIKPVAPPNRITGERRQEATTGERGSARPQAVTAQLSPSPPTRPMIYAVSGLADGILLPAFNAERSYSRQATKAAGFYWGLAQPLYFIPWFSLPTHHLFYRLPPGREPEKKPYAVSGAQHINSWSGLYLWSMLCADSPVLWG